MAVAQKAVWFFQPAQVLHQGAGAGHSVAIRVFVRNDEDVFGFQQFVVNLFGNNGHI